jgi:hypothetical protein
MRADARCGLHYLNFHRPASACLKIREQATDSFPNTRYFGEKRRLFCEELATDRTRRADSCVS